MAQHYISVCFWNVQARKRSIEILGELVQERGIDVVALAESPVSSGALALSLAGASGLSFASDIAAESSRRITWAYKTTVAAAPIFDGDKVSIREINPPLGLPILIGGIHASSRIARDIAELNILIQRAAIAVSEAESKRKHDRTIVIGDFNMSPFDYGIVSSESFHGVMSRDTASRQSRVIYEESRKFFYNPMWKLIAADSLVCGTYHHSSNSPLEYFWHCYDQVLVRPSLLANLPEDPVEIVRSTRNHRLVNERGVPAISDHLPIVAKMTI